MSLPTNNWGGGVKTNRTSFLCRNRYGHHNTERNQQYCISFRVYCLNLSVIYWIFFFTTSLLFCDLDFHQTVDILVGTICSHVLIGLFLYPRKVYFLQGLIYCQEKRLAQFINFTFRYIEGVPSWLNDLMDHIYPSHLKIKNTTVCQNSASIFNLTWKLAMKND